MMGKASRLQKPSRWRKNLRFVLGAGIAVYGITVFIRRDFLTYMFLQTQFVFLDFSEPVFLFYLDYNSKDTVSDHLKNGFRHILLSLLSPEGCHYVKSP